MALRRLLILIPLILLSIASFFALSVYADLTDYYPPDFMSENCIKIAPPGYVEILKLRCAPNQHVIITDGDELFYDDFEDGLSKWHQS